MRKTLIAIATAAAPMLASAHAENQDDFRLLIGEEATLSMSAPGCPNEDITNKVKDLMRDKDIDAAVKHLVRSGCSLIEVGKRGKVEHHSLWNGNICIRFHGEPDCLWFPSVFVVKPSATSSAESNDEPRAVDNQECKDITGRLIKTTGAEFDHTSPMGNSVFLRHSLDKQMVVLSCMTHRLISVSVDWDGASPSSTWFALAVKAGNAVTGEVPKKLDAAIRKCHRDALNGKSEFSGLELPKAKIECQAFVRDGAALLLAYGSTTIMKPVRALGILRMTDDPAPGLWDELMAALDVLAPQIDGLDDLMRATVSAPPKEAIAIQQTMDEVNEAMKRLIDDGHPNIPAFVVPAGIYDDLQEKRRLFDEATEISRISR